MHPRSDAAGLLCSTSLEQRNKKQTNWTPYYIELSTDCGFPEIFMSKFAIDCRTHYCLASAHWVLLLKINCTKAKVRQQHVVACMLCVYLLWWLYLHEVECLQHHVSRLHHSNCLEPVAFRVWGICTVGSSFFLLSFVLPLFAYSFLAKGRESCSNRWHTNAADK